MKYWTRTALALLSVSTFVACGRGDDAPQPLQEEASGGMGGMEGMPGMPGMQGMGGMQMDDSMMDEMRAHMQAMQGGTGQQFAENLPQHRQMVANMISQMNREMREMDMAADEAWNELLEELRQDLREMPEMSAQELESFMPEHRARVMRLMEMHQGMMGSMSM
ncbi:MAG: hypothetical protein WD627_10840 [Actinomycetota bacterium]